MQPPRQTANALQQPDAPSNGRKAKRVVYPSGDGKPMAETSVHIAELIRCFQTLEDYFAADARACVAPNLFVVKGVVKGHRDNFKVWEEGAAPAFVLELTSASTA